MRCHSYPPGPSAGRSINLLPDGGGGSGFRIVGVDRREPMPAARPKRTTCNMGVMWVAWGETKPWSHRAGDHTHHAVPPLKDQEDSSSNVLTAVHRHSDDVCLHLTWRPDLASSDGTLVGAGLNVVRCQLLPFSLGGLGGRGAG